MQTPKYKKARLRSLSPPFRFALTLLEKHLVFSLVILFMVMPALLPVFAKTQDLKFTHLTTDDGLSRSNVICILQDSKNFMWFGTSNGLNRYDGYEFTVYEYHPDDSSSISHNYITSMIEDHEEQLWIGTSDGLNLYNRTTNGFSHFKHDSANANSLNDNQIEAIFEDSQNRLWVGTRNGGLNLFDPASGTFQHFIHDDSAVNSISSNYIQVIIEDQYKRLWIGHSNGNIDLMDNQFRFTRMTVNNADLADSRITGIVNAGDNNMWVGTQANGLFHLHYDINSVKVIKHYEQQPNDLGLKTNTVLSLFIDSHRQMWIGTENEGLHHLDLQTGEFKYYKNDPFNATSLNHNSVWALYEDVSGNIWIGTYAGGINLLTNRKPYFQHIKHQPGNDNSLSSNIVNAFTESGDNSLWIATDGGGLDLYDRSRDHFTHYTTANSSLGSNFIVCLYRDSRDRFWIGTWANGLCLYHPEDRTFETFTMEDDGLGSNNILHIQEDRNGGLWLSTFWGGLTYFNMDTGVVNVYNMDNSGLTDNDVRVVQQDPSGKLWIGTDVGLDVFDPETGVFKSYKHHEKDMNSLSKGFVLSLFIDQDATVWIGTIGGLNRYDPGLDGFVHYTMQDGLPNEEIKDIVQDDDGNFWLSTNKGISRFSPATEKFKNYDVSDGLQGNEFTIRSGYKTSTGEIVFGGTNGFNIFVPGDLVDNPYVPPVVITDFRIFNKPVPINGKNSPLTKHIEETKELDLSYRHSVISFDFKALNYVAPEKNQYAFIMEGFETDWNYVGPQRTATYTNLDPGSYVFRVRASNNDGVWNNEGTFIRIHISPPFWKTWWAYLLETLLVIGILILISNYFISRQRLRGKLKLEHLELEKMYEMDQMKTHFFSNISHEFHSPITLILGPLEKLVREVNIDNRVRETLVLIQRNAKRLQRMVNQLKDFYKLETGDLQLRLSRGDIVLFVQEIANSFQDYARDHQIDYQFHASENRMVAWFDPDKMDKIIYNLLSNAFKFTPDHGSVTVNIEIVSNNNSVPYKPREKASKYVKISVQDSGIGIPEDKIEHIFNRYYHIEDHNGQHYDGSGVGLAFVYELLKMYQGDISVSSREGQGANFTVQIPIDEHYLEENQLVAEFNVKPIDQHSVGSLRTIEFKSTGSVKHSKRSENVPVLLIVEDDVEIRNYIRKSLDTKFRIFEAGNGREALKKAHKIIPDLIISDIKMPEYDGIYLCNQLKQDENTSHIPIVLLTAYTSPEYEINSLIKGIDAYITKPFNIDILEAKVVNLLESRKKLRDKFSREIFLGPKKIVVTDVDEQFLKRIIDTVEKHMSDTKFNSEILSKKVGMSRMQLYRKIRGLTDQTVHEFIRSIRLKRAVQLLEEKRMTITEVAYEVGFNDLTYFARCFRKEFDKSPSEYVAAKK